MNNKLRSSVSVVNLGNNVLELFKTNTRKAIHLRTNDNTIEKIILSMDGHTSDSEIGRRFGIDVESENYKNLISYLKRRAVLANDNLVITKDDYSKYRRVIHFIEDYSDSDESLLEMWENIRNSTVVIIGLGAVGTWTAINLVQSGVKNLILIDNDVVDVTNLHRQFGFCETDVGKKKTSVIANRLKLIEEEVQIREINSFLGEMTLSRYITESVDLIINCADKPSVDQTSEWVGKYCMDHDIPHIIGGGYNLHLSLVGQTIIPKKTACYKCFDIQLREINDIEGTSIKRLNTKNRKIGSFGPMCSIVASFIGMEAVKVLSKRIPPDNVNRRGEFDIYEMQLKYNQFDRLEDCPWCGGDSQ
ncbi:MAG: ThiF family adenylyltransferase [Erysipelotrichaceae bacterium]|nr:ThiF family adenylyltransferase [Erysipelotrichaceae bacterium]